MGDDTPARNLPTIINLQAEASEQKKIKANCIVDTENKTLREKLHN